MTQNAESVAVICDAWVGLEPPESADCLLPVGHEGPHESELHGSVRGHRDQYEHVFVKVVWPARIDGSEDAK